MTLTKAEAAGSSEPAAAGADATLSPSVKAKVAVVLVSYNCAQWLDRCLTSLPDALQGVPAEVIVVDNASTDGSAQVVESLHPEVTLIRNEINSGFAAAVNQGARASDSDWVLLLNPDMEARPHALANLVRFAERNPGHGLYGGRTLKEDGSVEPSSCWDLPTLWSTATFAFGLSTLMRRNRVFDPEAIGGWDRDSVREVGMITGCLLLVDRVTWNRLEGMDERYFVYGEDADFSARSHDIGARPIITPDAEVIHAGGVSSGNANNKIPLLLAGKMTYNMTHFKGIQRPIAVWLLRFAVALRALFGRVTRRKPSKWSHAWTVRESWWNGFPPRVPAP